MELPRQPAWPNQWVPDSVRDLVSKKKGGRNQGKYNIYLWSTNTYMCIHIYGERMRRGREEWREGKRERKIYTCIYTPKIKMVE